SRWEESLQLGDGRWIVDAQVGSRSMKPGDDGQARRASDVIGIRLEGRAEHGDGLVPQHPQGALDLREQALDARFIDPLDLLEQIDVDAVIFGDGDERAQILGQAGAAEAEASVHKMAADSVIQTDAPGYRRDIDAKRFAQIGHHVDERDLGGEESIRRLLDEFRRCHAREHDRAVEAGLVEVEEERSRAVSVCTDDDSVWLEEIANRRTLAKELRIAGDIELAL